MKIRRALAEDAAAIAAVHVTSWQEHYRGLLPDEVIESRTLERRLQTWTECLNEPNRVTFVHCNDTGNVTGFSSAIILSPAQDGFDSYLQTLYLLAANKGHGIGRALLRATAAELQSRGCRNMSLRVLAENPARHFYERLGARVVPDGITLDAGVFPGDVVYAFDDLRVLL